MDLHHGRHPSPRSQGGHPAHLDTLARLAQHPKVIAWGEIGLDYFYDHSPRDLQERIFRQQMELAHAAKLPIIIHCRDAWHDCLALLNEVWKPTGLGGILHCFTSTLEDAYRGIDMDFLVSFTANITYPKAQNIRDVAKALPLEKVLIETDSPYLAPQPVRGKRNEPAYVAEVAKVLANVRDFGRGHRRANHREFLAILSHRPARCIARWGVSLSQGGEPRRMVIALLTAREIFELVRDDLVKVEQELSRQSASAFQPVSEITSYLLGGGGKRLRPALLLLCHGYAAGRKSDGRSAIRLAAVVRTSPQRHADS